jgi:hypothetical protein
MKTSKFQWRGLLVLIALMAVLLSLAPQTEVQADNVIAPPNTSPLAKTYSQWTVEWWRWALAQPIHNPPYSGPLYNPLFVTGNVNCAVGQSWRVWFIGGVYNESGTATRTCTIPYGTSLFFPIVNGVWDNIATDPPLTVEQLRANVADFINHVTAMHASIDGTPVANLNSYRAKSPVFGYSVPLNDNLYQHFGYSVPGSHWPSNYVQPAVADGYWLFVNPLPPGPHVIKFDATVGAPYNFSLDITYNITVQPPLR